MDIKYVAKCKVQSAKRWCSSYLFKRGELLHLDALAEHTELVGRPRFAQFVSDVVARPQQALDEGVVGNGATRGVQFQDALYVRADGLQKKRNIKNVTAKDYSMCYVLSFYDFFQ